MSGKRGRGNAFPSDVVCSEQMCRPLSLWEPWSRKRNYKEFGSQSPVPSEIAVESELDFLWSCDILAES